MREVSSGSWKPSEGAGSPGSNPYKRQAKQHQTEKQHKENDNGNPNSTRDEVAVAVRSAGVASAAGVGRDAVEDTVQCR